MFRTKKRKIYFHLSVQKRLDPKYFSIPTKKLSELYPLLRSVRFNCLTSELMHEFSFHFQIESIYWVTNMIVCHLQRFQTMLIVRHSLLQLRIRPHLIICMSFPKHVKYLRTFSSVQPTRRRRRLPTVSMKVTPEVL